MAVIKGITIDITASTDGLNKALSKINGDLRGVTSELNQVNKLLKLDPSNTELLAQKQKLLKDAVAETSMKLGALKQAQQEAAAAGKGIDDDNYRRITREIASAENQLNKFNNELNQTKRIDLSDVADRLGKVGSVAGHAAATIGKSLAIGVAALGTAVVAVGGKMVNMAVETGAFADELLTLSAKTNLSTETLQKWSYAAAYIDTDMETMTGAMAKMTKRLETSSDKFTELGVATRNSSGEFRTQEEIFMDTIDALGKIENATQRDALAMEIFGKSAQELNPLIKAGGEELRRLGEEAIAAGVIISEDTLRNFGKFDDLVQSMGQRFSALQKNITGAFLPAIQSLAEPLNDAMGQINVILSDGVQPGDFDQILDVVRTMMDGLTTMILDYIPKIVSFIGTVVSQVLLTLIDTLPVLLPVLVDGLLKFVQVLLNAVSKNVKPIMQTVMTVLKTVVMFLLDNLPMIVEAAFELLAAFVEGIIDALPELIPKLIDVLLEIVTFFLENIPLIIDLALQLIIALATGLVDAIPEIVDRLPEIIKALITALIVLSPMLFEASIQLILALAKGLINAIPKLLASIPEIVAAIVSGFSAGVQEMSEVGRNLVQGLWEGISNSYTWIKNKITNWVGDIMKFIKKLFGIASPSKVMEQQVGLQLGAGVAEGITDSLGLVKAAMGSLTGEVEASVNPIINPTANSNPLILRIENFNNNRLTDVQALMEEAEFYRRNTALAGGFR